MCSEKSNSLSVLDFLQALKQESQGTPLYLQEGQVGIGQDCHVDLALWVSSQSALSHYKEDDFIIVNLS